VEESVRGTGWERHGVKVVVEFGKELCMRGLEQEGWGSEVLEILIREGLIAFSYMELFVSYRNLIDVHQNEKCRLAID
jgi:hypothetical protein